MAETLAILYASASLQNGLINKLNNIVQLFDIGKAEIIVNPEFPISACLKGKQKNLLTVIIGWGRKGKPSWETILPSQKHLRSIRQLFAIDLYEREGVDGRVLGKPMMNAGKYWSERMRQYKQNLFFEGYFLHPFTPYGLKKVKAPKIDDSSPSSMSLFVFEPGEPAEVGIVRMIFDLFVGHDYNFSEIANLLNAQEVNAPKNCRAWNPRPIKTILKSPLYIGANKFRGFIKYDVFPAIIEKPVYFEAQAKISQMSIFAGNESFRQRTQRDNTYGY